MANAMRESKAAARPGTVYYIDGIGRGGHPNFRGTATYTLLEVPRDVAERAMELDKALTKIWTINYDIREHRHRGGWGESWAGKLDRLDIVYKQRESLLYGNGYPRVYLVTKRSKPYELHGIVEKTAVNAMSQSDVEQMKSMSRKQASRIARNAERPSRPVVVARVVAGGVPGYATEIASFAVHGNGGDAVVAVGAAAAIAGVSISALRELRRLQPR